MQIKNTCLFLLTDCTKEVFQLSKISGNGLGQENIIQNYSSK
jgi:hypothetical protein